MDSCHATIFSCIVLFQLTNLDHYNTYHQRDYYMVSEVVAGVAGLTLYPPEPFNFLKPDTWLK